MKKHFLEFIDDTGHKVILDIESIIALKESKTNDDSTEIFCHSCPNCFVVNKKLEYVFQRISDLINSTTHVFE